MALRRAQQLVRLMVREFQPIGATWAELKHKSGMARSTYKRAFNLAKERKWFVGSGEQRKPFFLNPDGSWRAALLGPDMEQELDQELFPVSLVEPDSVAEIGTNGPSGPNPDADSHLALISEAIAYVDQKRRS